MPRIQRPTSGWHLVHRFDLDKPNLSIIPMSDRCARCNRAIRRGDVLAHPKCKRPICVGRTCSKRLRS